MTTDRELLELAAKAAGLTGHYDENGDAFRVMADGYAGSYWWNPLADDGDALRLAGQLQFDLVLGHAGATVLVGNKIKAQELCHPDSGGNYEATRRAIVRAAAEIGGAMP